MTVWTRRVRHDLYRFCWVCYPPEFPRSKTHPGACVWFWGVREGQDRKILGEKLYRRFQKREEQDIARIQKMVAFAAHDACLTHFLLACFGGRTEGVRTLCPLSWRSGAPVANGTPSSFGGKRVAHALIPSCRRSCIPGSPSTTGAFFVRPLFTRHNPCTVA